jgi:hypothetical protein
MSALAPLSEPAPSIQTQQPQTEATGSPPRPAKAHALRRLLGIGT